ncbi:MAG: RNA 2',3'-cyclic phosphodiesterase [Ignavibacteria bacterium]|nr:RNA 2',3'-cyclic phosphodiesterase [Ignavibacteria bacterium]
MSEFKRLFIGTFIYTTRIQQGISILKKELASFLTGKWVEEENLHFTYHFLGEVPAAIVQPLYQELLPNLREYDVKLEFNGINCFPNLFSPRVLFIEISDTEKILSSIYNSCKRALQKYNIPIEEREFHPHLTLVRIKSAQKTKFLEIIKKYQNYDFGFVEKFKVELIESRLTTAGPIYKSIKF